MNIQQILDTPSEVQETMAKVKIKGKVGYISNEPKHVSGIAKKGPNVGKPYSFYTQFITVEDDTGTIGVDLQLGESADKALTRADQDREIEIWGGRVNSYNKKDTGERVVNLRGYGEMVGGKVEVITNNVAASNGSNPPGYDKYNDMDKYYWRERQGYILVENINTAVANIISAAMTGAEKYKLSQVEEVIPSLVKAFYDADMGFIKAELAGNRQTQSIGPAPAPVEEKIPDPEEPGEPVVADDLLLGDDPPF
jgi:hypothetical protein